jgi:hypothetical protein
MNDSNAGSSRSDAGARHAVRVGDHVTVRDTDNEGIVTAVHPNSTVEVEFLHASSAGERRRHYALEAIQLVE